MTYHVNRAFLVAEQGTLEHLISTLDQDSVLERVGLEARLADVTAELAALDATTGCTGEWLDRARAEAEHGFAELDRGEDIRGTVAEHMSRIDAAVRTRAAERAGR
jgi:hypothetical protein